MSKCLGRDISVNSTLRVSIELPATSRHSLSMTERLLKVTLSPNQTKIVALCKIGYFSSFQQCGDKVEI